MATMEWDDDALKRLEEQTGKVLNDAVRDVALDMEGLPPEEIKAEITRRVEASGLGFNPGKDFDEIAQRISDGTFFISV
jgi:methyl coenzyme M reductase subunit C-like uncharacterized protein (methanogenesis marker protein 7)